VRAPKPFKTTHRTIPHFVGGQWINDVGSALNMMRMLSAADQQVCMGIGFCTDHGDDCAAVTDASEGNVAAPCYSQHKYLAKFRAYNPGAGGYYSFTDQLAPATEFPVDLSAWWPPGLSSGPILIEDEIFPCFHDVQRGMLVPLWVPMTRMVILGQALVSTGAATAHVVRLDSAFEPELTGKTISVRSWDQNPSEGVYQEGWKGFAHWINNAWMFTSPACFADDTGLLEQA
jgi:hypothetical protein